LKYILKVGAMLRQASGGFRFMAWDGKEEKVMHINFLSKLEAEEAVHMCITFFGWGKFGEGTRNMLQKVMHIPMCITPELCTVMHKDECSKVCAKLLNIALAPNLKF
jgi:hypothetical protein